MRVHQGGARGVVESTGNLWIQAQCRLEDHGFDVAVSSPVNSRLVSESRVKTDRTGVRALARLHWAGVLSAYFVPCDEERSQRELLRHQPRLVKNRTRARNRVHAHLYKHGRHIPYMTLFSKRAVRWIRERSLGFMDDVILGSDLALLEVLNEQIGYVV